jgi:hypothetical protein
MAESIADGELDEEGMDDGEIGSSLSVDPMVDGAAALVAIRSEATGSSCIHAAAMTVDRQTTLVRQAGMKLFIRPHLSREYGGHTSLVFTGSEFLRSG